MDGKPKPRGRLHYKGPLASALGPRALGRIQLQKVGRERMHRLRSPILFPVASISKLILGYRTTIFTGTLARVYHGSGVRAAPNDVARARTPRTGKGDVLYILDRERKGGPLKGG